MIAQFYKAHKTVLVSILIWLAAVLTFFSPAVFNNKVIAPLDCLECVFRPLAERPIEEVHNHFVVDSVSQYLPYKWSIKKSFEQDGYIGWTPYTFNGNPIPDNTMVSPGDLNNLLYALLPFWTAWDLGVILQFFIAGCGMILLLRHYKLPLWALLLGAISFAFYSQFILWMYHKWLGAMIWAPFLVWAMLKYRQRIINVPAIIFMTLIWRTGHLQSCVFGFMIVACMWVSHFLQPKTTRPAFREICRFTFSYLLIGILGALLSLDVFVDTLQRMEGCKEMPFGWGINNLLTIGSLLFPTTLGIPETLDIAKAFKLDLFDIKFGGGLIFILALIACFNSRAPREAKILFIGSFIAACTPLFTYLYSRSTLVMALGMSWLAAWQLFDFTKHQYNSLYLKRIFLTALVLTMAWFIASITIHFLREPIIELLDSIITGKSGASRAGRTAWNTIRATRFVDQILIWDWRNLLFCCSLLVGTYCFYKIKAGGAHLIQVSIVVLLTFAELLTFASTWITYSPKPDSSYLYNETAWITELRKQVKDGSVIGHNPTSDKDFWINNQLSGFDIRLGDGYETFRPHYLRPTKNDFNTGDYAQAGISHIISNTKWENVDLPGWKEVMTCNGFKVLANPDYRGRYFINQETAIRENWRTCNRIHLSIPAGAKTLTVLESYHKGWKASVGDQGLCIEPTKHGGMQINLPPGDKKYDLLMEFHMPYRWIYHPIMLLTAIGLLVVTLRRKPSAADTKPKNILDPITENR